MTRLTRVYIALFYLLLISAPMYIRAQENRVSIDVTTAQSRAKVQIDLEKDARSVRFRRSYASLSNLQSRIHNVTAWDSANQRLDLAESIPGEHTSSQPFRRLAYEVDLSPPSAPENGTHASWLSGRHGVLMPGDLLPEELSNASGGTELLLNLKLPDDWLAFSATGENRIRGEFRLKDPEAAVIAVGADLKSLGTEVGGQRLDLVTAGDWAFTPEDALELFSTIVKVGQKSYGGSSSQAAALFLFPFTGTMAPHRWSAETRGQTVFLLSGRQPSRTGAITQLNVALAHEALHLWVPNALALDGNYDWFFEGFTTYQALRVGVSSGFLTFADFLSAIARAFDSYRSSERRDLASLVELSRRRWSGSEALIYNKGALVAFLYDLAVRDATKSRQSVERIYEALLRSHRKPSRPVDGDSTVLEVIRSNSAGQAIAERFVEGREAIDLKALLKPYGLILETNPVRSHIKVASTLTSNQKSLLKRLGYSGA